MTTLTEIKTNITNQIIAGFGAEDEKDNIVFKQGIQMALDTHLNPFVANLEAKAQPHQPQIPTATAQQAKKKGAHGYNLFTSEFAAKQGKEKFKEMGGLKGSSVREAWAKLTDDEKKVYNERAKADREAANAPQMVMTSQGIVPVQIIAAKREKNPWQVFQAAWSAEMKKNTAAGMDAPSFATIGERSKACSAAYTEFKQKTDAEKNEYLHAHI